MNYLRCPHNFFKGEEGGTGSIENVWLGFNPLSGSDPAYPEALIIRLIMALWLCTTFCAPLKMRGLSTLHVAKSI